MIENNFLTLSYFSKFCDILPLGCTNIYAVIGDYSYRRLLNRTYRLESGNVIIHPGAKEFDQILSQEITSFHATYKIDSDTMIEFMVLHDSPDIILLPFSHECLDQIDCKIDNLLEAFNKVYYILSSS